MGVRVSFEMSVETVGRGGDFFEAVEDIFPDAWVGIFVDGDCRGSVRDEDMTDAAFDPAITDYLPDMFCYVEEKLLAFGLNGDCLECHLFTPFRPEDVNAL